MRHRAGRAVRQLRAMNREVHAAALLDADGTVLAGSGDDQDAWAEPVAALLRAAEATEEAGTQSLSEIHVAVSDGEVLAVRTCDRTMVAVSDRFALASLLAFDMRRLIVQLDAAVTSSPDAPVGDDRASVDETSSADGSEAEPDPAAAADDDAETSGTSEPAVADDAEAAAAAAADAAEADR